MIIPANFSRRTSLHRALRLWIGIPAALVLLAVVFVLSIGHWLVREDPLAMAQAIVVLSGGMPVRAEAAAALYRAGWAPEVWLTRSKQPAKAMAALKIPYNGEEYYNTLLLLQGGVPAGAIHVLPEAIVNTADEVAEIAAALPADKSGAVIIVTTKAHTRRVGTLWRRIAAGRGHVIVRAASGDAFDPGHWWRNSGDALDVVRECLGLLNTWAGLPLHSS
jgi:uncharacterized SAM-binding protein YcdF (DUF218 family)